ncbi:hypothetical protein APHAL10511_004691 [Amanita phalloides]|nr:hypothetical protein APHAL10511_004691 [Amanita phalloides]
MANSGGARLFQRPIMPVRVGRFSGTPAGRGISSCPYTEEELNFNVRRALEELRQDFPERRLSRPVSAQPDIGTHISSANTKPIVETPTPADPPNPKSNRYVVDCIGGTVRVVAIPTGHSEQSTTAEKKLEATTVDATSDSPDADNLSAQVPSHSNLISHITVSSPRRISPSATSSCAQQWDLTAQPLMFSTDVSCSSTNDDESEIPVMDGCLESVASWARLSRDACAPHPKFFFADGTLELLVENSLYKVHHHFFEYYSSFFLAIFTSLKSESTNMPTSLAGLAIRSHKPIHLPDITTIEFDRLLSIIYPTSFAQCDIASMEEWTSVLNLSSKLEFTSIYDLAVHNIAPKASVIDKALLGKRYGVKPWVVDSYSELCAREKPLTIEEGRQLGIDLVIKINELRHELFFSAGSGMDPHSTSGLTSMSSLRYFDELPEKVIQHFKLQAMDDGVPEGEGIYFKAVLDANP